jgi:hypothetical protein
MSPLGKSISIGIIPTTEDADSRRLMKGIGTSLGNYSARVYLPYLQTNPNNPDAIVSIAIRPDYHGSGWNFWINLPGFLIWTPAWNGYVYRVNYDVEVMIVKGLDNAKIDSFTIPIKLNIRHADIGRTWTEISWLEVGVIAFIGGLVFMQYDDDVTPILVEKIESTIGDYIAQEIISRINNSGLVGSASPSFRPSGVSEERAPSVMVDFVP